MKTIILSFFRNKSKSFLFITLFIISFIMMLMLISSKEYYQYVLDNGIGSQIDNRKLLVLNNDDFPKNLDKNNYIKDYYPNTNINCEFNDDKFLLQHLTEAELNLISGKYILKKNQIIVPKELESYLNNYINIKVSNDEYTLQVVGISDIDRIVISKDFINELIENLNLDIEYYIVISNNYSDIKKIVDSFDQNGYISFLANDKSLSEYNELAKFIDMLNIFIYILIIFDFVFIIYIIKSILNIEKREIAILKAIGFSNLKVNFIIITRILLIILISSFLALLLYVIAFSIINNILNSDYVYYTLEYKYIDNYILFILLTILFVLLNTIYIFLSIKNVDVVNNLMED